MLGPRKLLKIFVFRSTTRSNTFSFCQSKHFLKKDPSEIFHVSSWNKIFFPKLKFEISESKSQSDFHSDPNIENYLKKVQIKVYALPCICKKRLVEVDVPIRVFRTHYTVTFMPSEQFLVKRYSDRKNNLFYDKQKDSVLTTYKLKCKHCGHEEKRTFPENGLKFGTVITGCDHCNHVELVRDNFGWIDERSEQRMSKDLNFSREMVNNLIKRNLRKVGINSNEQPQ